MQTPVLETDRLILRPLTLHDAPAIQRWFATWEIIQHLSDAVPWPYPNDGAEEYLSNVVLPAMQEGAGMSWAITVKTEGPELRGMIEYRLEDAGEGHRGFWLAKPLWGRGYMTEAVIAMQDHVLLELGHDRLVVVNNANNAGSASIKHKTGANFLDTVQVSRRGKLVDVDRWEVTSENWAAHRRSSM